MIATPRHGHTPPWRFFSFFITVFLLFLTGIGVATADWTQRGSDPYNSRYANGTFMPDPDHSNLINTCLGIVPNSSSVSEPLILTNQHTNNTIIALIRIDQGSTTTQRQHLELYILNMTGNHNCGHINGTLSGFVSGAVTSHGLQFSQPAAINRSNSTYTLVVPIYEGATTTIRNLSLALINISNNNDAPLVDKTIFLNYTGSNRTVGKPASLQGRSASVKCINNEICFVYVVDNAGLLCVTNISSGIYACENKSSTVWTGHSDIYGSNLVYSDRGEFTVFENITANQYYIRTMIQNQSLLLGTNLTGDTHIIGWQYLPNTNVLQADTRWGTTGDLLLINDPYDDSWASFPYLYSEPAIIQQGGTFLDEINNLTLAIGVSQACQSTSGACGNGQDNTTLNRIFFLNAWTGTTFYQAPTMAACSTPYTNLSMDVSTFYPKVGEWNIVRHDNDTFACMHMRTPDAYNYSFNGEVYSCNNNDRRNIAGVQCWNMTPERYGGTLYDTVTQRTTPWAFTSLNSSLFNATNNGPAGISFAQIAQNGPRLSPFGLIQRQRASYNTTLAGAWMLQSDSRYPAHSQNDTAWVFDGAPFLSPYGETTVTNKINLADIDAQTYNEGQLGGCLGNGIPSRTNENNQRYWLPLKKPEWSTNPLTDDSTQTRSWLCENYHLYAQDSDNQSSVTTATSYSLYGNYPVWASVTIRPSASGINYMQLSSYLFYPDNHTSPTVTGVTVSSNIFNLCQNTSVIYKAVQESRQTNDTWGLSTDCDTRGETLTYGKYVNGLQANVSCTYNTTGSFNTTLYLNDYFTSNTVNQSYVYPVEVTVNTDCSNTTTGGAYNDTNQTSNVPPNFGNIIHPSTTLCSNLFYEFKVENYTNPERTDMIRLCVQDLLYFANINGTHTEYDFTQNGSIIQTCGVWKPNATNVSVSYRSLLQGNRNVKLYLQDQAHTNLRDISRTYTFNFVPPTDPTFCLNAGTTTDNPNRNTRQSFDQSIRAAFAQMGLTSNASQLGAFLGLTLIIVLVLLFKYQAPIIAIILVMCVMFLAAIYIGLIPLYLIFTAAFISLAVWLGKKFIGGSTDG